MAQRVQHANLVRNFKVMAAYIRGACEDKRVTQSYYNRFMQINLGVVKVYLTQSESEQKACVAAPYQISQGSLQPIQITTQAETLVTSVRLPQAFILTDTTTVGEFAAALLSVNTEVRRGDQLTVVHNLQSIFQPANIPHMTMKLHYVLIDPESVDILYEQIPPSLCTPTDGYIGTDANAETGGIAYVWSRKNAAHPRRALVSTQSIVLTPGNTIYQHYSSEAHKQEAINSYTTASTPCYSVPGPEGKEEDEEDLYFAVKSVTLNAVPVVAGSGELSVSPGDTLEIKGSKLTTSELKANVILGGPTGMPATVALSALGTVGTAVDTSIVIAITVEGEINYILRADNNIVMYSFV
jgi:hypothetical protein